MMITRSEKKGAAAIGISLASLAVVHGALAVAHHVVNDATPFTPMRYSVDRHLEWYEGSLARALGGYKPMEHVMHETDERMEEIERMILEKSGMTDDTEKIRNLLREVEDNVAAVTVRMSAEARNGTGSLELYTHAVELESQIDDIIKRVDFISSGAASGSSLTGALTGMRHLLEEDLMLAMTITQSFTIDEAVAAAVRDDVAEQRRTRLPVISSVPASDAVPANDNICGMAGDECASASDCCASMGLVCQKALLGGRPTSVCTPDERDICEVRCLAADEEGGTWSTPQKCIRTVLQPGTPSCDDLSGNTCLAGRDGERVRTCIK